MAKNTSIPQELPKLGQVVFFRTRRGWRVAIVTRVWSETLVNLFIGLPRERDLAYLLPLVGATGHGSQSMVARVAGRKAGRDLIAYS